MPPAHVEVENNINAVAENNMRLKHYQEKVIKALKDYLGELDIARNEYKEMMAIKPNLAKHINFPKDAWEKSNRQNYLSIKSQENMGKTDNIKRAKKLREAKRKREQDALIAAGLGPAGIALQKRTALNGGETKINQAKVKYSELLKAFVHPIVAKNDDITIIKTKYTFGAHAWNAATMREKSEEAYQLAKKDFINISPNVPEVGQLFDEMVKRKQDEFSEYKNIIADFEIKKIRGLDYDLTVATIPLKNL